MYVPALGVFFDPQSTPPILWRFLELRGAIIDPPYRDGGYRCASASLISRMSRVLIAAA